MPAELRHVVVVLPGIMGSVLEDADGSPIWKLSTGTILRGVLTRASAIRRLQLPAGIGDGPAQDGVRATALMPDLHVIPGIWTVSIGYDRLVSWFRSAFRIHDGSDGEPANFVLFPYDWRLSNRYNAQVLKDQVEPVLERFRTQPGCADARLVFVGHSMGGLVARYYTDVLGGHEVTAKVITLGTPHRGALNALESLVNGVRKGLGPLSIDLTELSRSLPALHQLLPEYACIEVGGQLKKTTETTVPELDGAMVADAMRFHDELAAGAAAVGSSYDSHPILARTQPTSTTARIDDGRVVPLRTIAGDDQRGDGTVPRLSAAPYGIASDDPILRYVMEQHGALPKHEAVLVECEGVLTGRSVIPRAAAVEIGVSAPDVLVAGETLDVQAESEPDLALAARIVDLETGATSATAPSLPRGGGDEVTTDGRAVYRAAITGLPPGAYELRVGLSGGDPAEEVTEPIVVLDQAQLAGDGT